MSDYWVKPTVDQLRAELIWEREQEKIRKKRRNILSAIAVVIAVIVMGGSLILPRAAASGYAKEETVTSLTESVTEETVPETEVPEEHQDENAVVSGE